MAVIECSASIDAIDAGFISDEKQRARLWAEFVAEHSEEIAQEFLDDIQDRFYDFAAMAIEEA